MTRRPSFRAFLMLAAALSLPACSRIEGAVKGVAQRGAGPFDKGRLDAAIDKSMGGVNTCVILADTKSGADAYRYGSNVACARELPPCSTFDIPAALAAVEAGATPDAVVKWDGKPQAIKAWEHDMSLRDAFKGSVPWYFQDLARRLGPYDYGKALTSLKYGNRDTSGPVDRFWMGPQAGGQLAISTRAQADFLHRLYANQLELGFGGPKSPGAAGATTVASMMVDEIRSGVRVSGKYASCPSNPDGSRQVGWYVGRIQGPKGDYVFAASIEGDNALPGLEVQTRMKDAFAQAGLWPAMS